MKNRPVLVKPYYTLDEVVDYLTLSGAGYLKNSEDILLLERENLIDVRLLCDEPITLINTRFAQYVESKFPDGFFDENLSNIGYELNEIDDFRNECKRANWVISISIDIDSIIPIANNPFNAFDLQPIDDEIKSPLLIAPFFDIGEDREVVLKPLSFKLDGWLGNSKPEIVESSWLSIKKLGSWDDYRCAVEVEGETFYVCKDMKANPYTHHLRGDVEIDKKATEFNLRYRLDNETIDRLIEKENFVVTKEELQRYEQSLNSSPQVSGIQKKREKVIEEYLINHELSRIKTLTLQQVWSELEQIAPELFRTSSSRTIGDCLTKCRNAGIPFPKLK